MARIIGITAPFYLGFGELEQVLERVAKVSNEGYPPYNIERLVSSRLNTEDRIRITLALAGFSETELDITVEENRLTIHGKQCDDKQRVYLHRGIAARRFRRSFMLAKGIEIKDATLDNGLLEINLVRYSPQRPAKKISIVSKPG